MISDVIRIFVNPTHVPHLILTTSLHIDYTRLRERISFSISSFFFFKKKVSIENDGEG